MEVKILNKKLREGVEECNDGLLKILELIGKAHDCIMEAQDLLGDIRYEVDDEGDCEDALDSLEYILDDLESDLSEHDHMGEDDPVAAFKEANE